MSWRDTLVERDAGYITPCLEWTKGVGARNPYGRVQIDGKRWKVHVLVWVEAHGEVPDGFEVCHHCDNPPCARLDHLYIGTHQQNMVDAVERELIERTRGEAHGGHKLTEDTVREIRNLRGTVTQVELAERFGVSSSLIACVQLRQTWRHVA